MKKLISALLLFSMLPGNLPAGLNFGLVNAAKKRVARVDEKVEAKRNEILASHVPALSWTGEPDYVSGGVHPPAGTAATPFVFRVSYRNRDGYAPAVGYPKIHIKKGGADIAGSPFAMTYVSGTYGLGAVYSHTAALALGEDYSCYFSAKNINGQDAAGAPVSAFSAPIVGLAPALEWTGEPDYSSDGLSPETGVSTTAFVYRIKYTEAEGDPPAGGYPRVHIKEDGAEIAGSPFAMSHVSGTPLTGSLYSYSGTLGKGSDYTYYFEAEDSDGIPAPETAPLAAPGVINSIPVLSWTREAGYAADGLNPEIGSRATNYVFRVSYSDPDSDEPASGYPKLRIKKGAAEIAGSPFTMGFISGTPGAGSIYSYSAVLPSTGTDYSYYFEALDAENAASTGTPVIVMSGPEISNTAPELRWTGETDYVSGGVQPVSAHTGSTFTFRVSYSDYDGDAPAAGYPRVRVFKNSAEISGSPFTMSFVSGAPAAGAVYTCDKVLNSTGTDYSYYFEAKDSLNSDAAGDPLSAITAPAVTNTAPALSWTGESGYLSGGLSPGTGAAATAFVYRVKYSDADGDPPASGYPRVHILKTGSPVSGSPFAMTFISSSAAGYIYSYSKVLPSTGTDYAYYFEAKDQFNSYAAGSPLTEATGPDIINWSSVSAGRYHSLAVKTDGTLWAWGEGGSGESGLGDPADAYTPEQVGTGTGWFSVSGGWAYTLAITTDGALWAWGNSSNGRLGLGSTSDIYAPTRAGTDADWALVSGGGGHTLAVKTDGTLWTWGYNDYGQLGAGNETGRNAPAQAGAASDWAWASAGKYHSAAVKTGGTLWTWGYNTNGQLGLGNAVGASTHTPNQVGTDSGWASVSSGWYHTAAVKNDGTLWAWGNNSYGQLGTGNTISTNTPVQAGSGSGWASVSAGEYHTLAVKTDGTLWAWGKNTGGQLGLDDETNRNAPARVGTGSDWASVSCGGEHTLAVKTDGTLWTWGNNGSGQAGLGEQIISADTPAQAGY